LGYDIDDDESVVGTPSGIKGSQITVDLESQLRSVAKGRRRYDAFIIFIATI
jgi:hypothetical protein